MMKVLLFSGKKREWYKKSGSGTGGGRFFYLEREKITSQQRQLSFRISLQF